MTYRYGRGGFMYRLENPPASGGVTPRNNARRPDLVVNPAELDGLRPSGFSPGLAASEWPGPTDAQPIRIVIPPASPAVHQQPPRIEERGVGDGNSEKDSATSEAVAPRATLAQEGRRRNERWHHWSAAIVTFLFVGLQLFLFMFVVPVVERERVDRPDEAAPSSLDAIRQGLNELGLEGETFFNDGTKMFCESVVLPRTDGSHEGRYEVFNTWSNMAFVVFGVVQWVTVGEADEVVLLMASVAMFMGVGSLLFHHYGYFAYWALDVLPMVMLMEVLLCGLWVTTWRSISGSYRRSVLGCCAAGQVKGCPDCFEVLGVALAHGVSKLAELLPFLYLWAVLAVNVLFFIDRATVKVHGGGSSVFLQNNPGVDEADMRGVLQLGTTELIVLGAAPLAALGAVLMLVSLGLTLAKGADWLDTGREPDTWTVFGLFARVFVWLGVAFWVWAPEVAEMEKDNGAGCLDRPQDFALSHYFWHFFAALALHHAAVYIAFRRAEHHLRDGRVHYFPLCWVERRWPDFFGGFEAESAAAVGEDGCEKERSVCDKCCGNPRCNQGCWRRWLQLWPTVLLRSFLQFLPWVTWDELPRHDLEAIMNIQHAWTRLETMLLESDDTSNQDPDLAFCLQAQRYIGNLLFQGFNEPRLSIRLAALRRRFREDCAKKQLDPQFKADFKRHFKHVAESLEDPDAIEEDDRLHRRARAGEAPQDSNGGGSANDGCSAGGGARTAPGTAIATGGASAESTV